MQRGRLNIIMCRSCNKGEKELESIPLRHTSGSSRATCVDALTFIPSVKMTLRNRQRRRTRTNNGLASSRNCRSQDIPSRPCVSLVSMSTILVLFPLLLLLSTVSIIHAEERSCSSIAAECSVGNSTSTVRLLEGYVAIRAIVSLDETDDDEATILPAIPQDDLCFLESTFMSLYFCENFYDVNATTTTTITSSPSRQQQQLYFRSLTRLGIFPESFEVLPLPQSTLESFPKNTTLPSASSLRLVSWIAKYEMESNLCLTRLFEDHTIQDKDDDTDVSRNLSQDEALGQEGKSRSSLRHSRRQPQEPTTLETRIGDACACDFPLSTTFVENLYHPVINANYLVGNLATVVGVVDVTEIEPAFDPSNKCVSCEVFNEIPPSSCGNATTKIPDNSGNNIPNGDFIPVITNTGESWTAAAILLAGVEDYEAIQASSNATAAWIASLEAAFLDTYNRLNSRIHGQDFCDPYNRIIESVKVTILASSIEVRGDGAEPLTRQLLDEPALNEKVTTDPRTLRQLRVLQDATSPSTLNSAADAPPSISPSVQVDLVELLYEVDGTCDGCPVGVGLFDDVLDTVRRRNSQENSRNSTAKSSSSSCFCPLDAGDESLTEELFTATLAGDEVDLGGNTDTVLVDFVEVDCRDCNLSTFETSSSIVFSGDPTLVTDTVLEESASIYIDIYNTLSAGLCGSVYVRLTNATATIGGSSRRNLQGMNSTIEAGNNATSSPSLPSQSPSMLGPDLFTIGFQITGVCSNCENEAVLFNDVTRRRLESSDFCSFADIDESNEGNGTVSLPGSDEFSSLYEDEIQTNAIVDGSIETVEEVVSGDSDECFVENCLIGLPSAFATSLTMEVEADPNSFVEDALLSSVQESFIRVYECPGVRVVTSFEYEGRPTLSRQANGSPLVVVNLHASAVSGICQDEFFVESQIGLDELCDCILWEMEEFMVTLSNELRMVDVGVRITGLAISSEVPSSAPYESQEPADSLSEFPSEFPTEFPTENSTEEPTAEPTDSPVTGSSPPETAEPSRELSQSPSESSAPSDLLSSSPSKSDSPSESPSKAPSAIPSSVFSTNPSSIPSTNPSATLSEIPSNIPSASPVAKPSASPSSTPSLIPSSVPSTDPSTLPSASPSASPTACENCSTNNCCNADFYCNTFGIEEECLPCVIDDNDCTDNAECCEDSICLGTTELCGPCGEVDADCSASTDCCERFACRDEKCAVCGGENQPCCRDGSCQEETALVCDSSAIGGPICVACGVSANDPCCSNGECTTTGLVCDDAFTCCASENSECNTDSECCGSLKCIEDASTVNSFGFCALCGDLNEVCCIDEAQQESCNDDALSCNEIDVSNRICCVSEGESCGNFDNGDDACCGDSECQTDRTTRVSTCGKCGELDRPCCSGNEQCGASGNLECIEDFCVCGDEGQVCCDGGSCSQDSVNLVCNSDNICELCGNLDDICCDSIDDPCPADITSICDGGLKVCCLPDGSECSDNDLSCCGTSQCVRDINGIDNAVSICGPCGEKDLPCCKEGNECSSIADLECVEDDALGPVCVCGGEGQVCCEGSTCSLSTLKCDDNNQCVLCGELGEACCDDTENGCPTNDDSLQCDLFSGLCCLNDGNGCSGTPGNCCGRSECLPNAETGALQCQPCGSEQGQQCCQDGDACSDGLECDAGICVCGDATQVCCNTGCNREGLFCNDSNTCCLLEEEDCSDFETACCDNFECNSDSKVCELITCGSVGKPCCANNECTGDLECLPNESQDLLCQECGIEGKACCETSAPCSGELQCNLGNGQCEPCGGLNQQCCTSANLSACNLGFCFNDICIDGAIDPP